MKCAKCHKRDAMKYNDFCYFCMVTVVNESKKYI